MTSAVTYRDAVEADASALSALARETWLDTFGPLFSEADSAAHVAKYYGALQQAAEIADSGYHHHLAFRADDLIGYCRSGRYTLPADVGGQRAFELHRLYVTGRAKGSGAAQSLMDDAITWASASGGQELLLSVYHANARAIAFYSRNRFEAFAEHVFMVGETPNRMFILRRALP